jgi:hypothetical protein
MKRQYAVLVVVALAFQADRTATAEDLYSLGFPYREGTFNVIDGKPYLLRRGEHGSPGNAVDIIDGGKLVHYDSKKPLVYPLAGENPVVSLGKEEGTSDRWDLTAFPRGESRTGHPVRAAEGKFKGWYLHWSDEETEIMSGGRTFHVRLLKLVKEPKTLRTFSKYVVAK